MNDILNLVHAYVRSGVVTLEQIGVGSIQFSGKDMNENMCIVYVIDGQKYLIKVEPVKEQSEPEQEEKAFEEE